MEGTFLKWIYTNPIKEDKSINNKYLINKSFEMVVDWINSTNNIYCNTDYITFKINFFKFIYTLHCSDYYYIKIPDLYYDLSYHNDIINLYFKIKDFINSQGSLIFNSFDPDNLLSFLINNTYILEDIIDNDIQIYEDILYED
tara:strand:- start:843 stop:1271 length:429 start_codon:yes stop_codon:yes gene_type:complete